MNEMNFQTVAEITLTPRHTDQEPVMCALLYVLKERLSFSEKKLYLIHFRSV